MPQLLNTPLMQSQRFARLLAFLLLLFALLSDKLGWFQNLAWYSLDHSIRWHAAHAGQPHPDILLIDIDDDALTRLTPQLGSWPWPRSAYAYLLEGFAEYQVKSWVFDILLTEADKNRPEDDAYWLETINRQPTLFLSAVLLPSAQGRSEVANTLPAALALQSGKPDIRISALLPLGYQLLPERVGMINAVSDADGVFRRYPLQLAVSNNGLLPSSVPPQAGNWLFPSLPWRVAAQAEGSAQPKQQQLWLTYQSEQAVPYPSIGFADAFQLALNPQPEHAELFHNKILVVGSSAVGLADLKHTAIAPQQPGMVLLATAIDNLLQENALQRKPDTWLLLLLCWQLVGLSLLYQKYANFSRYVASSVSWTLLNCLSLVLAVPALMNIGWLFAAGPILLWLILSCAGFNTLAALREYLQRQHTTAVFGRFLDPRVVASLVGQQTVSNAEKCQITVLFTDIRGFTQLSEQLDAAEVMALLNRYLSIQVNTLFAHQATLDKFIGDAIMAFWGAPLAQPNQADLALAAATAMLKNLEQFKQSLPEQLQHFDIGIGIHSGEAVVGLLGTEQRLEYTAIGDTVNVASRLESVSKTYGRVLCSEQTYQLLANNYPLRPVDSIQLKGRQASVRIYKLGD
uniref:Adenylate cyclase n=1 Tax=Rheinheimera sp. BAL341 TaxID=1708203 RepID=A0A486XUE5_9GAMM